MAVATVPYKDYDVTYSSDSSWFQNKFFNDSYYIKIKNTSSKVLKFPTFKFSFLSCNSTGSSVKHTYNGRTYGMHKSSGHWSCANGAGGILTMTVSYGSTSVTVSADKDTGANEGENIRSESYNMLGDPSNSGSHYFTTTGTTNGARGRPHTFSFSSSSVPTLSNKGDELTIRFTFTPTPGYEQVKIGTYGGDDAYYEPYIQIPKPDINASTGSLETTPAEDKDIPVWVYDNGSWKQAKKIWVYNGSTWNEATHLHVYNNSIWDDSY